MYNIGKASIHTTKAVTSKEKKKVLIITKHFKRCINIIITILYKTNIYIYIK